MITRLRRPARGSSPVEIPTDVRVLVAAAFVVALGYGLIAPILPQYARSFDVSFGAATVVVSAFAFFRLLFAPGAGALVDRIGERRVYMTGLLIVAVSTLATGLARDYWTLLLVRGLGGIGSTMFTVSAMTLLARLAPPMARGRVSGMYATAFLTGNICGPVLGGLLGGLGMRVPFFLYAGALVVATAVVAVFLREGQRRSRESDEAALPQLPVREALRLTGYRTALTSSFANGWASFGVRVAVVPLFVASTISERPGAAGFALASFAVGTASVVGIAGRVADRVGRRPLVVTGATVAGLATIAVGTCHSLVPLVAASVVAGVGAGILNPAQQAAVADVIGPERSGGRVMATFQMASDLGAILGPVLVGQIVDAWGFGVAFGVTGAILLVAAGVWALGVETLAVSPGGRATP